VELPPLAPTSVAPLGANDTIGLLFLSRLDPKKNLEGLLDAMPLLRKSAPQARLVIAGDGPTPYVEQLKAHCARLEIADVVHWAGHLESDAREAAFANASIFVLPSFSENFGMAAAEALARGLPCVLGAGVAISQDVVRAGAGVAIDTDAQSICNALRLMIEDTHALAAMSSKARQLAHACYSMQAMGASLKQLYTEILAR
ncbi:MAG: glycosyltransferase, partial [Ramlibacter sp.]|nr:glycosyltransferase [Ramlibacter sp.]